MNLRKFSLLVSLAACLGGCGIRQPLNLSFPVGLDEARDALREMRVSPQPLQRPVIVLSGFLDPGLLAQSVVNDIRSTTTNGQFETAGFLFKGTFDDCREHVIAVVDKAFPNDDPRWTTEVDVIAISMGGVVARYAALPPDEDSDKKRPPQRRLKIARLFTISSPHRGAEMAVWPSFDRKQINMRPGSPFIKILNQAWPDRDYQLYAYVRDGDTVVGEQNAAPPGELAWWVSNKFLEGAHIGAHGDERILADIARRLRGEQPFTRYPPLPLPKDGEDDQDRKDHQSDNDVNDHKDGTGPQSSP